MHKERIVKLDKINLVLGLDWLPLLGDSKSALGIARSLGANTMVLSGHPAGALGIARNIPKKLRCWSAAELFARLNPHGTVACLLRLDDGTWHLLASHQGVALVRADRSYMDLSQVNQAIAELRLAYPKIELLDMRDTPASTDMFDKLVGLSAAQHALRTVHKTPIMYLWPLIPMLLVLFGWTDIQAYFVPTATAVESAAEAWHQTLEQALALRPIHGRTGTRALLQVFFTQPANIAGWQLRALACQASKSSVNWQCRADYRRYHRLANNRGLLKLAPKGWRVDFPSLDRALAFWVVSVPGFKSDPYSLPATPLVTREWASALQANLAAFHTLHLEPPRRIHLVAPKNEQGVVLPKPASLPIISTRKLLIDGPLGSAVLLPALSDAVAWHKASLVLGSTAHVDLRNSRIKLHLEGIVYENQS